MGFPKTKVVDSKVKLEYSIEEKEVMVNGKKVIFPVKVCTPQRIPARHTAGFHRYTEPFPGQPSGLARHSGKIKGNS